MQHSYVWTVYLVLVYLVIPSVRSVRPLDHPNLRTSQEELLFPQALGHQAHLKSGAVGLLWFLASVTLRFSSSSWGEGAPGVSIYRLRLLSVLIPRSPVFLNCQRALSQLLSFIRSFAGQAVSSPQ